MSELRRWSEEGATQDEMRLLDAARGDRLSDAARAKMLRRAGISATVVAATATSGAAAAASGASLATKIVVGVFAVGVAAGGTWRLTRPASDADGSSQASAPTLAVSTDESSSGDDAAAAPAPRTEETIETASAQASAASAAPVASAPEPVAPAPRAVRPRPTGSASLAEEVAALEKAREALSSKSPEAALRELGKYDKRFPKGALSSEQTVLRVQALLARGERAKAISVADQFAAANPNSPYARRVQELVRASRVKK